MELKKKYVIPHN